MPILPLLCSRHYCPVNIPQLNPSASLAELSTQLTNLNSLLYNHRAWTESTVSNNNSIVVEASLPRRCIETAVLLLLHASSFPRERFY
jgi:hypothetical protein